VKLNDDILKHIFGLLPSSLTVDEAVKILDFVGWLGKKANREACNYGQQATTLSGAFIWGNTPQECAFWRDLTIKREHELGHL